MWFNLPLQVQLSTLTKQPIKGVDIIVNIRLSTEP